MSDHRGVGLLDGHFVYEDGSDGYEMDVKGQRVAIKPSFHSHIKFCFEHHDERAAEPHTGVLQPALLPFCVSGHLALPSAAVRTSTTGHHHHQQ